MKKHLVLFIGVVVIMALVSGFTFYHSVLHSGGMVFATGSPYDGNSTCGGCHSGGASTPSVTVTASPAFGAGNTYTPGMTYTINVTCSGNYPKYGFDIEILNSLDPAAALDQGVFGNPVTSNCWMVANAGTPTNVTHTTPSGTANTAVFSFSWTAPASDTAFIYCVGLGVNLSGTTSGDKVKSTSMVLTENGMGVSVSPQNKINLELFPNPAAEKLVVKYFLAVPGAVSITLYTLQGEKAADLLNASQYAGKQEKTITLPAGIEQGIYFLKVTIDNESFTKKIVIKK